MKTIELHFLAESGQFSITGSELYEETIRSLKLKKRIGMKQLSEDDVVIATVSAGLISEIIYPRNSNVFSHEKLNILSKKGASLVCYLRADPINCTRKEYIRSLYHFQQSFEYPGNPFQEQARLIFRAVSIPVPLHTPDDVNQLLHQLLDDPDFDIPDRNSDFFKEMTKNTVIKVRPENLGICIFSLAFKFLPPTYLGCDELNVIDLEFESSIYCRYLAHFTEARLKKCLIPKYELKSKDLKY